jgi:hypothetical protein
MHYTFEISIEALADGTFQPCLELKEEKGEGTLFHNYTITEFHKTADLALEQARFHALCEAKKIGLAEEDFQITVS